MGFASLASSADGAKLAGIFGNQYLAYPSSIFTSQNHGQTWAATASPVTNWTSVAISADGSTLIAGHFGSAWQTGGGMFFTTDSGQTWTKANVPDLWWTGVACSADGRRFVAAAWQDSIYLSTNVGATWTPTAAPQKTWRSLACSADATKLVATTADYSIAYFSSTNSGATWLNFTPADLVAPMGGVAISATGERMAVLTSGFGRDPTPCVAYLSTNFGVAWFSTTLPGTSNYTAIASSADGCSLVAALQPLGTYNYRVTPTPVLSIASSGDHVLLSWIVPSITFVLQENLDLNPANWSDVAQSPVLDYTNIQYQVSLPAPGGQRSYRLISR
jgi:hypothetical protein